MTEKTKVALCIGAGDGIGAGFVRRFAAGGYTVAIGRREPAKSAGLIQEIEAAGGSAQAFSVDARLEESLAELFQTVERDMGPVEVCLYNAGANYRNNVEDITPEMFEKVWRLGCFGGFLTGREAAKYMVPRGRGCILYTGATASLRGRAGFGAFASSKSGLRAFAQSLARELGPEGVHVAHLIVDGGVDSAVVHARRRAQAGDQNLEFAPDSLMSLASIGEAYWMLAHQSRDAWTFELDIRPFVEAW